MENVDEKSAGEFDELDVVARSVGDVFDISQRDFMAAQAAEVARSLGVEADTKAILKCLDTKSTLTYNPKPEHAIAAIMGELESGAAAPPNAKKKKQDKAEAKQVEKQAKVEAKTDAAWKNKNKSKACPNCVRRRFDPNREYAYCEHCFRDYFFSVPLVRRGAGVIDPKAPAAVAGAEIDGCRFVHLALDGDTAEFVRTCEQAFERRCGFDRVALDVLRSFLRSFMSNTDVNGLLGTGKMWLLSTAQMREMMGFDDEDHGGSEPSRSAAGRAALPTPPTGAVLDVGAGCGYITQQMRLFFRQVAATEVSTKMAARLRSTKTADLVFLADSLSKHAELNAWLSGKKVTPSSSSPRPAPEDRRQRLRLITCFNVLDRCQQPLTLLREMRKLCVEHGCRLLLSAVFPFEQWIEGHIGCSKGNAGGSSHGTTTTTAAPNKPKFERIAYRGQAHARSFEEQAAGFARHVLVRTLGFKLVKFARAPYISAGSAQAPLYVLSNGVFLLEPCEQSFEAHKDKWGNHSRNL
eukprot:g4456.t1